MFKFVVKYLGFLKNIPLMGQVFDSQLRLWQLISRSPLPGYLDNIEAEVLSWPSTLVTLHKLGGIQFNYSDKEIGHIHSNGILDIRFSRQIKQQLLQQGKVADHHVFDKSGWISFYIRNHHDVEYAKELLRMAYARMINSR